jgi:hypothetical protein
VDRAGFAEAGRGAASLHWRLSSVRNRVRTAIVRAAVVAAFATVPAEAQVPHSRSHVTVIPQSPLLFGGVYPHHLGFGAWYPQPYPVFGFPPPFFLPGDPTVTLRLQVTPRDATVFVDGYAAGVVDDFDGVFQRLHVVPGHHEIVVHHPRYRVFRQNLFFNPGTTHAIRHTMDPLGPGEAPVPPPVPRSLPPAPYVLPSTRPVMDARGMGTLVLRVQPGDASVLVDGEQWRGPQSQDRMVIQLSDGSHRVRIEKPGFLPFAADMEIRAGETTTLNVSLVQ